MFERDEQKKPIMESRRPLHVYFAFEKDSFMEAWNDVQLGEMGYNSIPKTFYYPLLEKKHHLPTISVFRFPFTMSPTLFEAPMNQLDSPTSSIPEKAKPIDLSELRLNPILPPSIDEQLRCSELAHNSEPPVFHVETKEDEFKRLQSQIDHTQAPSIVDTTQQIPRSIADHSQALSNFVDTNSLSNQGNKYTPFSFSIDPQHMATMNSSTQQGNSSSAGAGKKKLVFKQSAAKPKEFVNTTGGTALFPKKPTH